MLAVLNGNIDVLSTILQSGARTSCRDKVVVLATE